MKFVFTKLELDGVVEIEHQAFGDPRGFFSETFRKKEFEEAGIPAYVFVQENQSRSTKGVLRGLHYQLNPKAQGKLVRCSRGSVFDVAVDIRRKSPTFGKWVGRTLSDENKKMLWIPPGFAHGFCTLSELADVEYKVTDYWAPDFERGIRYDDPDLKIDWPIKEIKLSSKDGVYPFLKTAETNF